MSKWLRLGSNGIINLEDIKRVSANIDSSYIKIILKDNNVLTIWAYNEQQKVLNKIETALMQFEASNNSKESANNKITKP
jgi:hypothetical protein